MDVVYAAADLQLRLREALAFEEKLQFSADVEAPHPKSGSEPIPWQAAVAVALVIFGGLAASVLAQVTEPEVTTASYVSILLAGVAATALLAAMWSDHGTRRKRALYASDDAEAERRRFDSEAEEDEDLTDTYAARVYTAASELIEQLSQTRPSAPGHYIHLLGEAAAFLLRSGAYFESEEIVARRGDLIQRLEVNMDE